jgi:hypothetical protein
MSTPGRLDKSTGYSIKWIVTAKKEYLIPASQPFEKPTPSIITVVDPPELFFMGDISL